MNFIALYIIISGIAQLMFMCRRHAKVILKFLLWIKIIINTAATMSSIRKR